VLQIGSRSEGDEDRDFTRQFLCQTARRRRAELSLSAAPLESIAKLAAGSVRVIDNELQLNYLLRTSGRTDFRLVDGYKRSWSVCLRGAQGRR
jgi:hypothetical protein